MRKACEHFEVLIDAHVRGELSGSDEERLSSHVRECESCSALLRFTQSFASMLKASPDPEPPAGFETAVLSRLDAILAAGAREPGWQWRPVVGVLAACMALAIGFTLFVYAMPLSTLLGWSQELYYRFFTWTGLSSLSPASGSHVMKHVSLIARAFSTIWRPIGGLLSGQVLAGAGVILVVALMVSGMAARFLVVGPSGHRFGEQPVLPGAGTEGTGR